MDAGGTIIFLSWNDIIKLVVGFVSSAVLVWVGILIRSAIRRKILKRSVWNILKSPRSLNDWIAALDSISSAADDGNAYAISFDISRPLSGLIAELASLDPLNAYIYYDLLGKEEVVRRGISKLNQLQMQLVSSRSDKGDWSNENISIRKMIAGQSTVLKKDVIAMFQSQLSLMKHIQIPGLDAAENPVEELEKSLNKQGQNAI